MRSGLTGVALRIDDPKGWWGVTPSSCERLLDLVPLGALLELLEDLDELLLHLQRGAQRIDLKSR